MAKGPQLTQRKIDKLRDALWIVRECEELQNPDGMTRKLTAALDAALSTCTVLTENYRISTALADLDKHLDAKVEPE